MTFRNSLSCTALIALGLLSACQIEQPKPPLQVFHPATMPSDEAMQLRNWTVTRADYDDGKVPCENTCAPLRPLAEPYGTNLLTEPVLFMANVIAIPLSLSIHPPYTFVDYYPMRVDTGQNAMPPLPAQKASPIQGKNHEPHPTAGL